MKSRYTDRNIPQQVRHFGGNLAQKPQAIFDWDAQVSYRCFSIRIVISPSVLDSKIEQPSPPDLNLPFQY